MGKEIRSYLCRRFILKMAKDLYHEAVKIALVKEGWKITDDPYRIKVLDTNYEVDLGAEKLMAAERDGIKIAIEIKTFAGLSFTYEFHGALGQYLNYATFLELQEPERVLYLAVTRFVYDAYFQLPSTKYIISKFNLNIVVFDPQIKKIEQWLAK